MTEHARAWGLLGPNKLGLFCLAFSTRSGAWGWLCGEPTPRSTRRRLIAWRRRQGYRIVRVLISTEDR